MFLVLWLRISTLLLRTCHAGNRQQAQCSQMRMFSFNISFVR
jgi:hypothetical protein